MKHRSPKPKKDKLISAKQVAELLGVSVATVYEGKCGTGELTRVQLSPRAIRWSHNEVLEFLQRRLDLARAEQHKPLEPDGPKKVVQFRFRDPQTLLTKQEIDDICNEVRKGTK